MSQPENTPSAPGAPGEMLVNAARLSPGKVLNPSCPSWQAGIPGSAPVLVILAAGKGTRFGQAPKCVQPVLGVPLALFLAVLWHVRTVLARQIHAQTADGRTPVGPPPSHPTPAQEAGNA